MAMDAARARINTPAMLKPLTRDYWPPHAGRPAIRAILGLLGGPAIVVPLALLVALLLDFAFLSGNLGQSTRKVFQHGPVMLVGTFMIVLTFGGVAFLLLWSLRLRGKLAYLIAGFLVGVTAYLALPLLNPPAAPRKVEIILALSLFFGIYFALVFLAVRWVAGVRNLAVPERSNG